MYFDDNKFRRTTGKESWAQTFIKYLTLPYSIYLAQKSMFHNERSNEIYQKKERLTGERLSGCTNDLDIDYILERSKKSRANKSDTKTT